MKVFRISTTTLVAIMMASAQSAFGASLTLNDEPAEPFIFEGETGPILVGALCLTAVEGEFETLVDCEDAVGASAPNTQAIVSSSAFSLAETVQGQLLNVGARSRWTLWGKPKYAYTHLRTDFHGGAPSERPYSDSDVNAYSFTGGVDYGFGTNERFRLGVGGTYIDMDGDGSQLVEFDDLIFGGTAPARLNIEQDYRTGGPFIYGLLGLDDFQKHRRGFYVDFLSAYLMGEEKRRIEVPGGFISGANIVESAQDVDVFLAAAGLNYVTSLGEQMLANFRAGYRYARTDYDVFFADQGLEIQLQDDQTDDHISLGFGVRKDWTPAPGRIAFVSGGVELDVFLSEFEVGVGRRFSSQHLATVDPAAMIKYGIAYTQQITDKVWLEVQAGAKHSKGFDNFNTLLVFEYRLN